MSDAGFQAAAEAGRKQHEKNDVDQEHALAANAVGNLSKYQRAEKRSCDGCYGYQALGQPHSSESRAR